ncbi:AAA family ATPase [Ornithinimicrobium faecis]|uniref:AAA family ATPase n=1 Tax=Ornithinimicrobium faecis TaxID=2934158 RepID=A0ABY4YSQ5_9MICO|nr:AAA family ATPase [Ornithinimicrobium sp. HY1793]USQ79182.1 AAA family ATPase [Ornithinimicrobium sp. HY1793]
MIGPNERRGKIAYEEAANSTYLRTLEDRLNQPVGTPVPRNGVWLKGLPTFGTQQDGSIHPLVARLALRAGDDAVPRTFYIGPRHHTWDDKECFSWAAPVADLFFRPDESEHHLIDGLVARRTFSHRIQRIVAVQDETLRSHVGRPFDADDLVVPEAPRAPRRRAAIAQLSPSTSPQPPAKPVSSPVPGTDSQEIEPQETGATHDMPSQVVAGQVAEMTEGMRSPDLVLDRLHEPRTNRLSSVLTTLQPDQHGLASAPSDAPLVIQGHPGTGKTIVAAYRAAHLVDDERAGGALMKVLLVGPTDEYVHHVSGLLSPLVEPGRVRVVAMERLLLEAAVVKGTVGGALEGVPDDVDAAARSLTDLAVRLATAHRMLSTGKAAVRENRKTVYELLRANGLRQQPLSTDAEKISWMRKLPAYDSAVKQRRFLPLLAQCSLSIRQPAPAERFEHIIVDEAQDVSPVEWNVIDHYSRHGHWTLLGDMNQRRSDSSYSSWTQIADHLGLGEDAGTVRETVIRRGYRSTQAILRLADRLLPRELRGARSLQVDEEEPAFVRVQRHAPEALADAAVDNGQFLLSRHPHGTVAVIAMNPARIFTALHSRGWRRGTSASDAVSHEWLKGEERLSVHVPESARGLEFDAVVVVEPGEFPRNLGRSGQLYTSLTRANRELVVVYQGPLPDELRRAGRR